MKKNTLLLTLCCVMLFFGNTKAQNLLQSGPMVGYSEMREVMLWVQTSQPAKVKIAYWEKGQNPAQKKYTNEVLTQKPNAHTAHLLADQVEHSKKYEYELYINEKLTPRPYPLEFQTQVLWQFRTDPPAIHFTAGSCFYVNELATDRPGEPYGGGYEILKTLQAQKPEFMLWLGDNTYMRETDWTTKTGVHHRYTHTRSFPDLQPLLGNTHNYATWDDHDYGPNDSDLSFANKELTLETFKNFWANPNYGLADPNGKGVTGTFTWGDAQFFLLDDRYFRTAKYNAAQERKVLGEAQFNWLVNGLSSSQATFKFVVMGVQALSTSAEKENYANFPEERQKLLDAIAKNKTSGVIFLTGDRHFTELSKLEQGNGSTIYDVTISPLTAGSFAPKDEVNSLQVPNTLVSERNFAVMDITGKRRERVLNIRILNKDGKEMWQKQIHERELKR